MNDMSEYLKNRIIEDYFRTNPVYVALFNADADNAEVNGTSYQRQEVTFVDPDNGQTTNTEDILFPVAEEVWGNITHVGIYDSQTDGNQLFLSPAEFEQTIDVSSQYKIPKNYLIVRLR